MNQPQLLKISVVELDDGTNLRWNLQRNIGTEKASKQINQKKVDTRKNDKIATQK